MLKSRRAAWILAWTSLLACGEDEPGPSTFQPSGGATAGSAAGTGGAGGELFGATSSTVGGAGGAGSGGGSGGAGDCPPAPGGGALDVAFRSGDAAGQYGLAVAVAPNEDIVVAGSFSGVLDFGGGVSISSAGATDAFVARFSSAGSPLWAHRYGDAKDQSARDVAVDDQGDVYVTGHFLGTIDLGGGAFTSAGCCFDDLFVARLDAQGGHVWSKAFGDVNAQIARAVAVRGTTVAIAGDFQTTLGLGAVTLTSAGGYDGFVARQDTATGTVTWAHGLGDATEQSARDVAVGAAGDVVLTGRAEGAVDFGSGAVVAVGTRAAFAARFDPAGAVVFGALYGEGDASGEAVALGAANEIVITGDHVGPIDLGGGPLDAQLASNVFVAKLDTNGVHAWSRSFGDDGSQKSKAVAVGSNGSVVCAGSFSGSVDFGDGRLTSAGLFDGFVAVLDGAGCSRWSRSIGDGASQQVNAVAAAAGGVVVTGTFAGSVDLGGGPLIAQGDDVFVARFGP